MSHDATPASQAPGADQLAAMRAAILAGRTADILQAAEAVIVTAADPATVVEAVIARADALAQVGLLADAFSLLKTSYDKEHAAGRLDGAAQLRLAESALRMASGDTQAAISSLVQAANDFGDAGATANQIRAQLQLATVYAVTSQPDSVRQVLQGCLTAAQQLGDPGVLAEVLHQEGSFLMATGGDPAQSFADGVQAADRSGAATARIQLRVDLACAVARADANQAATLIAAAQGIATALTDPLACANGLATAAQGWWAIGQAADCLRCADQALSQLRGAAAWPMFVRLAVVITDMCTAAGRSEDAQRYLGAATAAGERVGGPAGAANVMVMLGQAAMQRGDRMSAQQDFRDAVARLQAAGLPVPPQLSAALANPGQPR